MAKKIALNHTIFVIDTSYLLELFAVPGCSEKNAIREIRKRYEKATKPIFT